MKFDWLKHAFAVEKSADFAPTPEQVAVAERLCRWIVKRDMTTPTILFLEGSRGLNYVGANMLHFFRPTVAALFDSEEYRHFAEMLEHRGSIDYLVRLIEQFEKESTTEHTESTAESEKAEREMD